jgi:hypothetical protein
MLLLLLLLLLRCRCWESPNGTSESRGQFPELYLRVVNSNS